MRIFGVPMITNCKLQASFFTVVLRSGQLWVLAPAIKVFHSLTMPGYKFYLVLTALPHELTLEPGSHHLAHKRHHVVAVAPDGDGISFVTRSIHFLSLSCVISLYLNVIR